MYLKAVKSDFESEPQGVYHTSYCPKSDFFFETDNLQMSDQHPSIHAILGSGSRKEKVGERQSSIQWLKEGSQGPEGKMTSEGFGGNIGRRGHVSHKIKPFLFSVFYFY